MERSTYGKLREFNLNSTGQEWTEYCEQMDFYFSANEITEAKQKKYILLASVGNDTFKLIRNLIDRELARSSQDTWTLVPARIPDNHTSQET